MYLLSLSGGVSARVAFAACQEKKYRIRRYMRQIRFWEVKASWIFLYSLLCQFSNMIPGLESRPLFLVPPHLKLPYQKANDFPIGFWWIAPLQFHLLLCKMQGKTWKRSFDDLRLMFRKLKRIIGDFLWNATRCHRSIRFLELLLLSLRDLNHEGKFIMIKSI